MVQIANDARSVLGNNAELLAAVAAEAGLAAALLHIDGRTIWRTPAWIEMMGDMATPTTARVLNALRGAVRHERPVAVNWQRGGVAMRAIARKSSVENCSLCAVMPLLAHDATPPDPQRFDVVHVAGDSSHILEGLTPSELRILRLIGEGKSTSQIADELHRSAKTIEWHRAAIGRKLGAKTRVELARLAIQHGLVHLGMVSELKPPQNGYQSNP